MAASVRQIPGVGPAIAARLAEADIRTTDALLAACRTRRDQRLLAARTGLPERRLRGFPNLVDRMRIRGVGADYGVLLVASGVRTVVELSRRRPSNLALKMSTVNADRKLSRRTPSETMVDRWVAQAKALRAATG